MAGCLSKCLIMSDCFRISISLRDGNQTVFESYESTFSIHSFIHRTTALSPFWVDVIHSDNCSIATDQLKEATMLQFNTRDLSTLYLFFWPDAMLLFEVFHFQGPCLVCYESLQNNATY